MSDIEDLKDNDSSYSFESVDFEQGNAYTYLFWRIIWIGICLKNLDVNLIFVKSLCYRERISV